MTLSQTTCWVKFFAYKLLLLYVVFLVILCTQATTIKTDQYTPLIHDLDMIVDIARYI
jgi:hypothetical protein